MMEVGGVPHPTGRMPPDDLPPRSDEPPSSAPWYANITDYVRPEPPRPTPTFPGVVGSAFLISAIAVSVAFVLHPGGSGVACGGDSCAYLPAPYFSVFGGITAVVFFVLAGIFLRDALANSSFASGRDNGSRERRS